MIQQLSAKPRTQDMQQAMVQLTAANTQRSGKFRSMLLKTAQSAKAASSGTASGNISVSNPKDRPDEESPPSLSGDSTQTTLSQAMLFAAQQTAAGEVPSGSVPNVDAQALQSAFPAVTEDLQAQRSATIAATAENLQAQQTAVSATENLQTQQVLSEVFVETPQAVTAQAPAQTVSAAQATQLTQAVSETEATVPSASAGPTAQTVQTVQAPQTSSQTEATDTAIRQDITGTPTEAEFSSATAVQTSEQTSTAMTEPIAETEKAAFAVSQKAQPLDTDVQSGTVGEPILSQKEEKDKIPSLTSRQATVPYSSEKVVVQISDTPAATKTPVTNQVANAVVQHLKTGKRQFQIDLYPQSLGKVSVKLVAEKGILTIEIAAANPKTQSLLASSSGEIRSLLQTTTGQTVEVTAQQPDAQQYTDQNLAGQQQQEQSSAQQQQQQEEAERRRAATIWYTSNTSGFSAADFLTLLQTTAVS
jgi:flagellar hook-length control protein FliK